MRAMLSTLFLGFSIVAVACGPGPRPSDRGGGGGGGGPDGGSNITLPDANCGTVEHPEGVPIPLPDGVCGTNGNGNCTCSSTATMLGVASTSAACTPLQPSGQKCWTIGAGDDECRESYTSTVVFSSFGSGQKLMQPSDVVSVCVNMSHEWLRDLEIDILAPSGQVMALDRFGGQTGDEVFVGHPANTDGDCSDCTPEMGMNYCWSPSATKPAMLPYVNGGGALDTWNDHSDILPAGTYSASDPWTNLVGATLNGNWTIRVTDLWPIDAGQLHSWTISFNEAIVQNCSTNPIQ